MVEEAKRIIACKSCAWNRFCILPPEFTSDELERRKEKIKQEANTMGAEEHEGFGNHASSYEEEDFINVLDWKHKPEDLERAHTLTLSDLLPKELRVHKTAPGGARDAGKSN